MEGKIKYIIAIAIGLAISVYFWVEVVFNPTPTPKNGLLYIAILLLSVIMASVAWRSRPYKQCQRASFKQWVANYTYNLPCPITAGLSHGLALIWVGMVLYGVYNWAMAIRIIF